MPNNINAHVAIMRQIAYVSANATKSVYQIRSSISADPLGSLVNTLGWMSNPGTNIEISSPNLTSIEIWLTSASQGISSVSGDIISIDIDFMNDNALKIIH
ncbi:MAG: hypothetical protein P4L35_12670 [Ignavibacteriaceae bacterium]|nr:hypothetical protein [Ignavibacteriaceae bacterium]